MSFSVLTVVSFSNVSYSYPGKKKPALYGIDLSAAQGEFIAVMGVNGSGKTTLLKIINGIIPHFTGGSLTGSVSICGEKTVDSSVPHLALKAGTVLDDPDAQLFTSTVLSETAFGPENMLIAPQEIEERVRFSLSAAGLSGYEERRPSTLSGGEKQRLCIAAALAMNSQILVLDDPLCRLDPKGKEEVMSVLEELKEKQKTTVIMSTHDSSYAARYADRVCILNKGRITALDTASNIFSNHSLLEENGIEDFTRRHIEPSVRSTEFLSGNFSSSPYSPRPLCLRVENLEYFYKEGNASIENINLEIADNEFLAIAGSNGCGKTTLLKNITGLLKPCSGDIFIRGRNVKDLSVSDISKEIGFVMQNPDAQLFTDSVYKEVSFALKNARLPKPEIKRRVEEALDTIGLKDGGAFPHALSRADRTRTVIACVLAMGCRIVILDEIDAGQDYRGRCDLMNIMKALHRKGFTIIFVTHNMTLAENYAQRLIVMNRKGIEFDGRR